MAIDLWTYRRRANLILLLLLTDDLEKEEPRRRDRVIWTRNWLKRRKERGAYHQLVRELRSEDDAELTNYFRMPDAKFQELNSRISHDISRRDTIMRPSIKSDERLAVTLRFLATGESFSSLEKQFRISRTAISDMVIETCEAITSNLGPDFLKVPSTSSAWLEIATKFDDRWNFPNALFAVDGKRVIIQQPACSGSHYYDYKGHNSILAMVAVGPEYEILAADVGMNGRMSDGGNWSRNKFRELLADKKNLLNIPADRPLPGRTSPVPFVAVGDDAFALTRYLLKPYPSSSLTQEQRIFNYRLSRMRRISENVLGIMAQKWRVLRNVMLLDPAKATSVVLAIMVLHNYLLSEKTYISGSTLDDLSSESQPSSSWFDLSPLAHGQNFSSDAKAIRNEFCRYFNFEGAVSWQWVAARIDG